MSKTYKKKMKLKNKTKKNAKIQKISKILEKKETLEKETLEKETLEKEHLDLSPFENQYEVDISTDLKINKKKEKKYLSKVDKLLDQSRNKIFDSQQSGELWKKPLSTVLAIPYASTGITPNQDFYTYINYRWIQDTDIISKKSRKYYTQIDAFRVTQEKVYNDVINLVKKYVKENRGSKRATLLNNVYKSMLNFDKDKIKVHIRHVDERYENYVVKTKNMWGFLAQMNTNEIISWACPIHWQVLPDSKHSKLYHNQISFPQLSLYDIELYADDNVGKDDEYIAYKKKVKTRYFSYIRQVFDGCLGETRGREFSAYDVFKCEQEILGAMGCYGVKKNSPDEASLRQKGVTYQVYEKEMKEGQVALLENVRFYPEEEKNEKNSPRNWRKM
jgi:hypothetical protein